MLPTGDEFRDLNFLSDNVVASVDDRLAQVGAGGLVNEDRLRRNLLSSQPLCFNLFGHLRSDPSALLDWVQGYAPDASEVTRVEVEWAPPKEKHFDGGSAFDAFVEYRKAQGGLGFVGVECKYAEDLPRTDVKVVREVYKEFTDGCGRWKPDAVEHLDVKGLRQFWLNTLLAQSMAATDTYVEGRCVVMSHSLDGKALQATESVRALLVDDTDLTWVSYDALLANVAGQQHDSWRKAFEERYLDLTPTGHLE
jgi:hypothetical protein